MLASEAAEALSAIAARTPRAVVISARTGQGMDALIAMIADELAEPVEEETLTIGFDQGRRRAWLFDHKLVKSEVQTEDGYRVAVRWSTRDRSRYLTL